MDKKKVITIVIICILLILCILAVIFGRKLVILGKISKANDLFNSNNYYYSFYLNEDKTEKCEVYYKDGKKLEKITQNNDVTSVKWIDEKNNEGIVLDPSSQKKDSVSKNNISFSSDKIISDTLDFILSNKFKSAINFSIKEVENDGKNYYKLVVKVSGVSSNEYYFDKETGKIEKIKYSSSLVLMDEIETNSVTDNDVKEPNLEDYVA